MEELRCKNCNGNLNVDLDKGIAVCDFCGSVYVLDSFREKPEKEKILEEISALERIGKYKKCRKLFEKLIQKYPADYEVYWKYVLFETGNLKESLFWFDLSDIEKIALDAVELAPDGKKQELREKWEEYQTYRKIEKEKSETEQEIKRKRRVQEFIASDLSDLSGAEFGTRWYGFYFLWENGHLMIDVPVKNGNYVSKREIGEIRQAERVAVSIDENGIFYADKKVKEYQEVVVTKKFLGFSRNITEQKLIDTIKREKLIIDGKEVKLFDVRKFEHSVSHYEYSSKLLIGKEEYLAIYNKECDKGLS